MVQVLSKSRLRVQRLDQEPVELQLDHVLDSPSSQEDAFSTVRSIVTRVLEGANGTILAYGQTGSGKTYTMTGEASPSARGLIPRTLEQIFRGLESDPSRRETTIQVSFLEIYAERVFDLLTGPRPKNVEEGFSVRANAHGNAARHPLAGGLEIMEGRGGAVLVPGLTVVKVSNLEQALEVLRIGTLSRTSGDNGFNSSSSRSHAIFQVLVEPSASRRAANDRRSSKLNLVDLAGSEKLKPESTPAGASLQELTCINLSLSTLGKCISAIVCQRRTHVPYRDSKLTRLLQDALSGQSLAAMIICISPLMSSLEETLSSLKFADRAKQAVLDHLPGSASPSPAAASTASSLAMARRVEELQSRVQELSAELQKERSERLRLEQLLTRESKMSSSKSRVPKRGGSLSLPISARKRSSSSKLKWDIVKHLSEHPGLADLTALNLGEEAWLAQAFGGDAQSTQSTSSSSDSEHRLDGFRSSGSRSSGKRAKGQAVLVYLQRLAKQNTELLARMEALEGRQTEQKEALERRRPGEELSPTPLPRGESGSPQKELWSTSQKEFCFEASPVHRGGSKESRDSRDSLHSPVGSAETATPKTGNSPSLEQRRELLKKARDDNARVRAELRQQDDRGHYSDCDPLHSEVKKLQEARKLLRRPA